VTDGQTYGQSDRQTDRQTDRQNRQPSFDGKDRASMRLAGKKTITYHCDISRYEKITGTTLVFTSFT